MLPSDFKPQSKLIINENRVARSKFPSNDAKNHLADPFGSGWDYKPISELKIQLDNTEILTLKKGSI
jgi:hypothetical protein